MTLQHFTDACEFTSLSEVDKVCYLAFYHLRREDIEEFSTRDASDWLVKSGCAVPNRSRLEGKLRKSKNTIKAQRGFRLRLDFVKALDSRFPQLAVKSEEVVDEGTILPEPDYKNTRDFIETLAKQINACYERNLFDACAVLMRRLAEVLLILSYRNLKIESAIQDAEGHYFTLERIVNDAKTNGKLGLSRNSKEILDTFRQLGNFSAHKIEYICRRKYIQIEIQNFRGLVSELLHKAGIRV
jgi:hypothetical protein